MKHIFIWKQKVGVTLFERERKKSWHNTRVWGSGSGCAFIKSWSQWIWKLEVTIFKLYMFTNVIAETNQFHYKSWDAIKTLHFHSILERYMHKLQEISICNRSMKAAEQKCIFLNICIPQRAKSPVPFLLTRSVA